MQLCKILAACCDSNAILILDNMMDRVISVHPEHLFGVILQKFCTVYTDFRIPRANCLVLWLLYISPFTLSVLIKLWDFLLWICQHEGQTSHFLNWGSSSAPTVIPIAGLVGPAPRRTYTAVTMNTTFWYLFILAFFSSIRSWYTRWRRSRFGPFEASGKVLKKCSLWERVGSAARWDGC